jgi:endopolyphosphatase
LVSPSVVPNYYPTLRVIEYNITGLEGDSPAIWHSPELLSEADDEITILDTQDVKALSPTTPSSEPAHDLKIKKKHKKNIPKKPNFKVPYPPSKTSPPGPAYSPQTFTFLSYIQYFANLTTINEKATTNNYSAFKYELEYDTKTDKRYGMKDLTMRQYLDLAERMSRKTLQETGEEEDVDRAGEVQAVKTTNKVWHAFVKRAFVMTKPDEQLDDEFG